MPKKKISGNWNPYLVPLRMKRNNIVSISLATSHFSGYRSFMKLAHLRPLKYVEYLDSSQQVMSRGQRVTQRYLCQVSIAVGDNIYIISVALSCIKGRSETLVNISSVYTTTTSMETVPQI